MSAKTAFNGEAMIGIVGFGFMIGVIVVGIEWLRWMCRPEARRLWVIKKIGCGSILESKKRGH